MNKSDYKFFGINPNRYNRIKGSYGRCIDVSIGLILGLLLDKALFIFSKGLSVLIPPMAVLLMTKGKSLFKIRFEKDFHPLLERFFISHITRK